MPSIGASEVEFKSALDALGPAPRYHEHGITPEIAGLIGRMARDPMAGGFGNALRFGGINGEECGIARGAGFHFDENDELAAPRYHVNLATMGCMGLRENVPAGEAQPEAREKLRLNPDTAGASTIRGWALPAQPSPASASADN